MTKTRVAPEVDGGYNALKGFAFQFDSTILEAFADPSQEVGVERDQDIDIGRYYIQVKLRGDQFSVPRVAKAVRQIMRQFALDTNRRYRLYGHFSGSTPGERLTLDADRLRIALADEADNYSTGVKDLFLTHFEIVFAPDLEVQFATVLSGLRARYGLKTDEEAIFRHGVLYHHLTRLVLRTPRDQRITSAADLDAAVKRADNVVFHGSYARHLGKARYLAMLKSELSLKTVNVVHRDCTSGARPGCPRPGPCRLGCSSPRSFLCARQLSAAVPAIPRSCRPHTYKAPTL
jgi:hypothetical protein